jgi:hypothetical protein
LGLGNLSRVGWKPAEPDFSSATGSRFVAV